MIKLNLILLKDKRRIITLTFSFVSILFLVVYPFIFKGYLVRLATSIIMYVALSQIWNILGGFAGYINLGLVGFIGIGAYATGVFMNLGFSIYLSILIAGTISTIVSLFLGPPILRLKSGYYSIATYALAFVFREISNNLNDITGGGTGLALPISGMSILTMNRYFYYNMLVLTIIVTLICIRMSKLSLGYGLHAIKEDEDAAKALGINTTAYKSIGFTISSFLSSVIGGMYAYWLTYIDPISAFDSKMSVLVIIMAMVGGAGTVLGPIIGGVAISLVSELLWSNFIEYHTGFLGMVLILTVIFLPQGVMDLFLHRKEKLSFKNFGKTIQENLKKYRI